LCVEICVIVAFEFDSSLCVAPEPGVVVWHSLHWIDVCAEQSIAVVGTSRWSPIPVSTLMLSTVVREAHGVSPLNAAPGGEPSVPPEASPWQPLHEAPGS
jgi:hypothetical protein